MSAFLSKWRIQFTWFGIVSRNLVQLLILFITLKKHICKAEEQWNVILKFWHIT